jgi:hypothetical protein
MHGTSSQKNIEKIKMASNGNKDPIGNLMDKLRFLFGSSDHLKNKIALPPKTR